MLSESFTFASALLGLAGGAMIGLSALLLLKGAGRIAGISGILNGLCIPIKTGCGAPCLLSAWSPVAATPPS